MKIKKTVVALVSRLEIMMTSAATLNWRLKLPTVILDKRPAIVREA